MTVMEVEDGDDCGSAEGIRHTNRIAFGIDNREPFNPIKGFLNSIQSKKFKVHLFV